MGKKMDYNRKINVFKRPANSHSVQTLNILRGDMMKKIITVRKNEKYRTGIFLFMIAVGILVGIISITTKSLPIMLLTLPWLLLSFALWLYYETWKIILEPKKIYKKVFFLRSKQYSYFEIKDAVIWHSYMESQVITISFSDGKSMQFRLTDENAGAAISRISSCRTVRTEN